MRYYSIIIKNEAGEIYVPNFNGTPGYSLQSTGTTYSSLYTGASAQQLGGNNPAAQQIELNIPVTFLHEPGQNAYVRINGIGLGEIQQASNLNNQFIEIYGGFSKGLPLANPSQSGLLVRGQIVQAFANWIGTDQTLDIYIVPASSPASTTGIPGTTLAPATNQTPANIIFNWSPGQSMQQAITQALSTAFPNYSVQGSIYSALVLTGAPETGFFSTPKQFADYLNRKSRSLVLGYAPPPAGYPGPANYTGVCVSFANDTFTIQDGTTAPSTKALTITDLIGQPTWSQAYTIQVTCPMRADVSCGDYITLPPTPGITNHSPTNNFNGNSYSKYKAGVVFSGNYMVTAIRHVGSSRDPNNTSWVTTLDCIATSTTTGIANPVTATQWPSLYTAS